VQYVDGISTAVIALIRAGAVCRVVLCLIKLMTSEEEAAQYKKRIKNTVAFYIVAELAYVIKNTVIFYFS
jgi:hypothetical protein